MWLILLDASGSMADPFSGASEFAGRTRPTKSSLKIDAAKESLIIHLRGLGETTDTAIFAFREDAELIYEGPSAQNGQIEAALASVEARGETDIAAALAAAGRHVDAHLDQPIIRLLLISDGLSNSAAAEAAATEFRRRRIPIDAILIDPSDQGEELVRRVVGGFGSVSAVTSMVELSSAIGGIGEEVRSEAAAASHAQASLQAAIRKQSPLHPGEDISFTAAYPGELAKDNWGSLLTFVHLSVLQEEARNRAIGLGQAKGSGLISPSMQGSSRLPRGTHISLTPRIPGFDINPPNTTLIWFEDIESFEFRIRPSHAAAEPVVGEVEVAVKGLPIARIPLSILVRPASGSRPGDSEPRTSVCGPFKTVFASYARTDLEVVRACANVYSSLGIYTLIDKDELIGGQAWRPAIRALMARADTFQLFWSKDSSVSPPVHEEVLDAISLQGDRGSGFIRPTYWTEPPPPLPPQLASLNFAFLDLSNLNHSSPAVPPRSDRETPLAGAAKLPVAILPLLPGTSVSIGREIGADTSFAVAFIEQTTAARYYPVPTLLVDRYTVRNIRASQTVDYKAHDRERQRALLDWASVISSISVGFHVANFWDGDRDAGVDMARRAGLDKASFEALRQLSEGRPRGWLEPAWARARKRDELSDITSLRDAAAVVVEAALASDLASANADFKGYLWKNEGWKDWRAELEPLGLRVSRQSYVHGTGVSFHAGLAKLWEHIEPTLVGYTDRLGEVPAPPERFDSAVNIANVMIEALRGRFSKTIEFVQSELDSSLAWRSTRAQLLSANLPGVEPEQTFPEFAGAFFGAINTVLREQIREAGDAIVGLKYSIPTTAWRRLETAGLADGLTASEVNDPRGQDDDAVKISGPISAFMKLLDGAWAQAKAILVSRTRVTEPDHFIAADVPTYGIFAPAAAANVDAQLQSNALEWDLRRDLILPGTDRVLLCGDALDDFRAVLTKRREQLNVARLFLRSILIHEHFHAFLETAPMNDGRPPAGPGFVDQWNAAKPVNEALAAWMQVHMARDNPALSVMIGQFISAGSYPEWPYAGAQTIESVHKKEGIEEIRSLINKLRSDPPLAVAWMEKHRKLANESP